MARTIGDAFVRIKPDTSQTGGEIRQQLSPQIARAGREQGRQFGQSFNVGLGGALKAVGTVGLTALAGLAGGFAAATAGAATLGIKTAASLEQAQIGFQTLLKSGTKAQSFLTDLKKFAAKTPFELPGLIDSSRLLLGVGVNAKQVIPLLTAFGDAAGAVGVGQEAFQRIMLATSQAISAGRFQTEDLNQITENGIPIWKVLAEATGKPVPKLRELASQGKLLAKDVLPILQKQMEKDYGGAMAKQSQTLAGVWSTLKDTVAIGLADAIKPLVPLLKDLLPQAAALAGRGLKTVSLAVAGLLAGWRGSGTAAEGIVGPMARIGQKAHEVFDFFGSSILPKLRAFAGFVTGTVVPVLVQLGSWLNRNREIMVVVAATFAAFKIVGFVQTILGIIAATRAWIVVQGGLNAVMRANVIGIIITVLAVLVASIIYAYKHSETFRNIVQGAWRGIQVAVSFAWNNVIKPAVTALVWYFQHVIAPVAMWLWNNVIKPAFAGISFAVKVAWVVIQAIFAAWRLYLVNVLFPVIRFLWNNIVKPVFSGIAATISFVWNKIIKPVFQALGSFIKDKVAPAFKLGVDAIRTAWDKVKDAAKAPVNFVINRVINPLIGGFNHVAGFLGVKDKIPTLPSIGDGPGPSGPGIRPRGRTGDGPGTGDGFGDVLSFFKGPAKWISDKAGLGRIRDRFGNSFLSRMLTAGGSTMVGWLKDRALSLFGGTEIAGGGAGLAGLQPGILGVLGALRRVFGNVPVISGFRPGAMTLTGNTSYHASGRAIDIRPVYAWAAFLNAAYGRQLRELITPWQNFNVLNGRPHTYTGAVWAQHNFAGGNAHIHAALDDYGMRTLWPGLNVIPNNTGRPEPIAALQGIAGHATYNINVNVPVGAHPAETGRKIVEAIKAFEQSNSSRWRKP